MLMCCVFCLFELIRFVKFAVFSFIYRMIVKKIRVSIGICGDMAYGSSCIFLYFIKQTDIFSAFFATRAWP